MKKLVDGIIDFRRTRRESLKETFARLALGQNPDALLICCSDSRVAPNVFASTDPGDLFVVRNVGNVVPIVTPTGVPGLESVAAAIEFGIRALKISDIIVCGHSECGAVRAKVAGDLPDGCTHLPSWVQLVSESGGEAAAGWNVAGGLSAVNRASQLNVIAQVYNLLQQSLVIEHVQQNVLDVHGWWFDIGNLDVYYLDPHTRSFALVDETAQRRGMAAVSRAVQRLGPRT